MRTVVITGAASGIGLALTRQLLREGATVVAMVRGGMPNAPDLDRAIAEAPLRVYRNAKTNRARDEG